MGTASTPRPWVYNSTHTRFNTILHCPAVYIYSLVHHLYTTAAVCCMTTTPRYQHVMYSCCCCRRSGYPPLLAVHSRAAVDETQTIYIQQQSTDDECLLLLCPCSCCVCVRCTLHTCMYRVWHTTSTAYSTTSEQLLLTIREACRVTPTILTLRVYGEQKKAAGANQLRPPSSPPAPGISSQVIMPSPYTSPAAAPTRTAAAAATSRLYCCPAHCTRLHQQYQYQYRTGSGGTSQGSQLRLSGKRTRYVNIHRGKILIRHRRARRRNQRHSSCTRYGTGFGFPKFRDEKKIKAANWFIYSPGLSNEPGRQQVPRLPTPLLPVRRRSRGVSYVDHHHQLEKELTSLVVVAGTGEHTPRTSL